ncbi:hypothetical protein HZS_3516 [Henneguya salminicola]|nr:hypothetical protein HZS_3516 [Henneguya salminicola]
MYKYLGAVVKNNLLRDHTAKETGLTNREISTWIKLRILKSVLMPQLLYGFNVWRKTKHRVTF